jgi:hypothetical protein
MISKPSDELKMSAFEYAYRHKNIAAAIGIEFDREGHLLPRDQTPEQIAHALPASKRAALEHLLTEFRANRLNTRSPALRKDTKEYEELLAKLYSFAPPVASPPAPGVAAPLGLALLARRTQLPHHVGPTIPIPSQLWTYPASITRTL